MAASPAARKARKSLTFLGVIIVALVGVISIGLVRGEATLTPKLALDLQGGTQILLSPKTTDGEAVSGEQVQQALSIIRQRVDASGVSEAEISTMGGDNISVSIPGKADEETLRRIEASARLDFRPVLAVAQGNQSAPDSADEANSSEEAGVAEEGDPVTDESAESADDSDADADDSDADAETDEQSDLYPDPLPEEAGTQDWVTPALAEKFTNFTCDSDEALEAGDAPEDRPLLSCDQTGAVKYILGPVEMTGDAIKDASAGVATTQSGASTGKWAVNIELDSDGTKQFGEISQRMFGAQEPLNQFAFVIDGHVLSAPRMNGQILDGRPQITGDFTEEEAQTTADQLKYGALPMSFTVQSQEDISATLGTNQLQAGLIAGLIGLMLVVVYSLFQYRALGSLTIASLAMAAVLTYLLLVLLSWRQGYRLSLAGVAGIIVSIGITADSFIVYFERIRDAVRDGFKLENAVEHGWKRAIQTILASDGINFLAAAILFILSIGNVRGFAFTLGLTTIVDLLVVTLFTHPMMTFIARTRFWGGGHKLSGLDPRQLGAVYRGRAQFRAPAPTSRKEQRRQVGSSKEAQRRQTIAERKAAAANQKQEG